MTQNQFAHYSYRHSEVMIFHQSHPQKDIEMMLIGVDFDHEMFQLVPVDRDWYEDEALWVPFKFVDKPRRKPKMKVIYCEQSIKEKENIL